LVSVDNGVAVVIKAAEMAVKLRRLGVSVASRQAQSGFALPSAQVLKVSEPRLR
jgi:allantoin racemase